MVLFIGAVVVGTTVYLSCPAIAFQALYPVANRKVSITTTRTTTTIAVVASHDIEETSILLARVQPLKSPKRRRRPPPPQSIQATTTAATESTTLAVQVDSVLGHQDITDASRFLYHRRIQEDGTTSAGTTTTTIGNKKMIMKKKTMQQRPSLNSSVKAADMDDELKQLLLDRFQSGASSTATTTTPTTTGAASASAVVRKTQTQQQQPKKLGRSIPAFATHKTRKDSDARRKRRNGGSSSAMADATTTEGIDATETEQQYQAQANHAGTSLMGGESSSSRRGRKSGRSSGRQNNNYPDSELQRYYRTDLLTTQEEFIYGERIQFMVACEEVHEGLALRLLRLPTLTEWAAACGYNVQFHVRNVTQTTVADEKLRPIGSEHMFQEVDPHLFIGNGLIGDAGPGRGRGRAKKIPHVRVKDQKPDMLISRRGGNRSSNSVALSSSNSPMNRGTVRDFLDMIQTGREAKQIMVQNNMRLVVSIARKYMNVGVSLNDLVQEGSLGLSRAAEKYDPQKGFKFSTYASWWIQQAVFRSIAYQSRTIRLPVHIHNMLNRIHRVRNVLTKEHGRAPTNEEMALQLGMSLAKYNKLLRLTKRSISLDIAKYKSNPKDFGHEAEDRLGDTISSSSVGGELLDETAPEKVVDHTLFLDDLKDMIQILDHDERVVLCARYGLTDGITRTVTSVAAEMKQSKSWVRSLECRALRKLRRPWYEKKLKEHESSLNSY